MLSDRDLKRAMVPSSGPATGDEFTVVFDSRHRVSQYMSWPARGISEETPLIDVARTLQREHISSLVVVAGAEARPVGIITTDDLVRFLISLLEGEGPHAESSKLPLSEFFERFRPSVGYLF